VTTVRQYVLALQQKQDFLVGPLGTDVRRSGSVEMRALNLELLIFVGGLMKALTDKGLLTDAEIDNAINSTLNDGWPAVPLDPPPEGA
jgi:hypothetical protein